MNNILAGHQQLSHSQPGRGPGGHGQRRFHIVELSAVTGWTEHVPLQPTEAQLAEIKAKLAQWGLTPSAPTGHSDLTTVDGCAGSFSVEIEFSGEPFPPLAEVDRSMKVSGESPKKLGMS